MMNINSLPEDCLRLILKLFPLRELIHLRLVCPEWRSLIELVFCESIRSLKLFGSQHGVSMYHQIVIDLNITNHVDYRVNQSNGSLDDILIVGSNRSYACQMLPQLFPNISSLCVCLHTMTDCQAFPEMLRSWPQMVSLGVYGMDENQRLSSHIWSAIESFESLKRLNLIRQYRNSIPNGLNFFRRLESFSLTDYGKDSVQVLAQLGPACKKLHLNMIQLSVKQLRQLIELNTELKANLTQFRFGYFQSEVNREKNFYQILKVVCENFKALNSVDLMFGEYLPLSLLIPELSKLPHLTELQLYVSHDQLATDPKRLYQLPQLRSVQKLDLEIFNMSPVEFTQWIPGLFPNVQQLTVKCNYHDKPQIADQLRKDCLTVEQFPKLLKCQLKY